MLKLRYVLQMLTYDFQTSRSPFLLYPYYVLNYGLLAWVLWGAGRAALGYKSPWGK
jgi:hypothetical protein